MDIDLTDGNDKGRHVQPHGYVPSQLAEPALRDRDQQRTALEYAAIELGEIRAGADIILRADGNGPTARNARAAAAREIEETATRVQRLIRALAAGALVALVAVGLSVGGARPAAAAEAPQPDPVASGITYRVTLDRPIVTLAVPFVTSRPVPGTALHCGSLWLAGSPVGYGCSTRRAFTVTARLDAAAVPVGKSMLELVDEATGASVTATLQARRPSRFGQGTWATTQYGDGLTVYATLYAYTPALGRYTPQQSSPVKVQEMQGGRWVTVATGRTNRHGTFLITVILGGGRHTVRVRRDEGATVAPANGTARAFYLYPTDVPDGVI